MSHEPAEGHSEVIPRAVVCCPLCQEEFKQPRILPCLHVYCQQCIQGRVSQATPGNAHCPECNTAVLQDTDSAVTLPECFFIRRLLAPVKTTETKDRQCGRCSQPMMIGKDEDGRAFHCVNCEEHLCAGCTYTHQEENETSSHKVEPLEQRAGNSYQPTSPKSPASLPKCCEYYDPLDVGSLFCVNCDTLTCTTCVSKCHSDHRCVELSAVAVNFENKVDEPLLDLEDNAHQLSGNLNSINRVRDELIQKQRQLRHSVIARKEFLVGMIESYTQTILAETDRQFGQKLADINQQRESTEHQISSINAVLNFTDNLLAYGTDEEKVSQRKRIGRRIRELSEIEIQEDVTCPADLEFIQPEVTVETICNVFGELTNGELDRAEHDQQQQPQHRRAFYQSSIDSGHFSEVNSDVADLGASFDGRRSSCGSQDQPKVRRKSVQFDSQVSQTHYETDHIFHLDDPIREFPIPAGIPRECIRGMGINGNGDIIIGVVHAEGHCIYIVEKRGIIRGKVPVETGWNLHSVAGDGKVSLVVNRGNNRYKVRVLKEDCSTPLVGESHIQSCGCHFVTANASGQVIVASNRYGKHCGAMGKSAKSGGNIAVHDKKGHLIHRFTNEHYQDFNLYVLERPCSVAVDVAGNIYMADAGSHLVAGFSSSGDLLFTFGNSDSNEDEVYEGPDWVVLDHSGNLIVTDKKANRIDILSVRGQLRKTFYTDESPKFVSAGLDKQLMVTSIDGIIKFYEYL